MILIVAAHPDDEAVGAATLLFGNREVRVVHVTDGAPRDLADARVNGFETRDAYAAARDAEARAALASVGIREGHRYRLGIVDQEASLRLAEVARALRALFERLEPALIVTHAYEGGHPDHDAVAFGVHAAVALLRAPAGIPAVSEMTSYHRGQDGRFTSGAFLNGRGVGEIVRRLDAGEQARKRDLLARYATQRRTLRMFRLDEERFRPAPHYDFTQAPHPGSLWYESFPWGMTGERFRDLVRYALLELGLRLAPVPVGGIGG
jgi:LmbE family N-acetylglucosaminyl deacetylase